jgi:hypothetical protein
VADQLLPSVEDFFNRVTNANIRFAVGSPEFGYSATWTAFARRNEYYIGARNVMGLTKISLHSSGICRVALTDTQFRALAEQGLEQPPDRAFVKWNKKSTPLVGAHHVFTVVFPTDYLKQPKPQGTVKKPLVIFGAAPAGKAVEVGFFYSREDQRTLEAKFDRIGRAVICTTLDNGDTVSLVKRVADFDRSVLPSQDKMDRARATMLTKDMHNVEDEHTGMFWNKPDDGGTLILIEVGGITLRRN